MSKVQSLMSKVQSLMSKVQSLMSKVQLAPQVCVKALASDLGRHVNYVYAMTARGFKGKSVAEARQWIEAHGFGMVRGKPKLKEEIRKA